jgi:hypothetical protein
MVIYRWTFEEHLGHITVVPDRLREAGLTMKPQNVVFATKEISFLGHLISPGGVKIDPQRTRAIREFPVPRDVKGISRFVGMVNYYHKLMTHFANVAAPLNALHMKGVNFVWGKEQEEAFEGLKIAISLPPVLGLANFSEKFILQTDASWVALGAVLSQEREGIRQPIAYASRTLSTQERKVSSIHELRVSRSAFQYGKVPQVLRTSRVCLRDRQPSSVLAIGPP